MIGDNTPASRELISQQGNTPTQRNYLIEFLDYLRIRTGFRPNHFRAPDELQATFQQMERARLPMSLWRSFLNATTRLLARSGMKMDRDTFIKAFVGAIGIVAMFLMDNFLLKVMLWIFSYWSIKKLSGLIILVYHFASFWAPKIWLIIAEKLEKYCKLAAEKLFPPSKYQLTNN